MSGHRRCCCGGGGPTGGLCCNCAGCPDTITLNLSWTIRYDDNLGIPERSYDLVYTGNIICDRAASAVYQSLCTVPPADAGSCAPCAWVPRTGQSMRLTAVCDTPGTFCTDGFIDLPLFEGPTSPNYSGVRCGTCDTNHAGTWGIELYLGVENPADRSKFIARGPANTAMACPDSSESWTINFPAITTTPAGGFDITLADVTWSIT